MESPLRQIVPTPVKKPPLSRTKSKRAKAATATTLATEEYGDMIEMGILDPTKVTRSALQYAASVGWPDDHHRVQSPTCQKHDKGSIWAALAVWVAWAAWAA
jgi:hypothetical protein